MDDDDCEWNRYYLPIPRTTYQNKTGPRVNAAQSAEYHYTPWDIGLTRVANQFEHADPFDDILGRIDYVLDEDQPIWSESK